MSLDDLIADHESRSGQSRKWVGTVLGGLIGVTFVRYVGASAWMPMLATVMLAAIFYKTPLNPGRYRDAIAITGGLVLWMCFAGVYTGNWAQVLGDIVVSTLASIALWRWPSLVPVLAFALLHLGVLVVNVLTFVQNIDSEAVRAPLSVHIVMHVAALLCLWLAYRNDPNHSTSQSPPYAEPDIAGSNAGARRSS